MVGLCLGGALAGSSFGHSPAVAAVPPVGTVWSMVRQMNAGTNGELNVTLSTKLDALTDTQITFRYTFFGEIGFITDQACNNPTAIPLPFNRVAFTISWSPSSNPGQPSPLVGESLLTSKLDYQAPTFVNCWNMANPPAFYSNAVSYVRYQGLKFSMTATVPRSPYFSEGVGHSVTFSATSNANPDGVNFVGGTLPVPSIDAAAGTTTTVKKSTTTTLAAGEATTTTVDDASTTTVVVTDTTEPVRNAVFPQDNGESSGPGVDVSYDLATETPQQQEQRKENTAESVAITAAVLVSSLAAAAPAVGAVGAAGLAGGVVGAVTTRAFSGGDLLPQVPRSGSQVVTRRGLPGRRQPESPETVKPASEPRRRQTPSEPTELTNPFDAPQNFAKEDDDGSAEPAVVVDALFVRIIAMLRVVSRFPFLRPGLRRLAEVSIVAPAAAAAVPLTVITGSALLAVAAHRDVIGSVAVLVGLFVLSLLAPVLAVLAVAGWFLGRVVMSPANFFVAGAESIALLPGLLIIPMMVRGIIGPRGRSRPWERWSAAALAPFVATYALKGWVANLSDSVGTLVTLTPDSLGWSTVRLIGVPTSGESWALGGVFAVLVMLVATAAVRYSEDSGHPVFMFSRWIRHDDLQQDSRREYINRTVLRSATPRTWLRPAAYTVATFTIATVLAPIVGWKALVLIAVFLLGVTGLRRAPAKFSTEVHPIVKKVPMLALGIGLGSIAVSPNRAFLAFAVIAVVALATIPVRTRQLWQ